jgi:hypothetical protein
VLADVLATTFPPSTLVVLPDSTCACEEKGTSAKVKCLCVGQQNNQGQVNGLLSYMKHVNADLIWQTKNWPATAKSRSYIISLVSPRGGCRNVELGSYAGTSMGPASISLVIGGLNLSGIPNYSAPNNVICLFSSETRTDAVTKVTQPGYITVCSVTYATTSVLDKRDGELDAGDPSNYEIISAKLEDNWEANTVYVHNGMPLMNETEQLRAQEAAAPRTIETPVPLLS